MMCRILPTVCLCLLLPVLSSAATGPIKQTKLSQPLQLRGIFTTFFQRINDLWHSDQYSLYIPAYTWHNRLMYDSDRVDRYTENPWGIGVGKVTTDEKGNTHQLFIVEFQDSWNKFEPYAGYAFQKNWYLDRDHDWSGGIGYVVGITAREQYDYIPFPLPLPIGGIQYKRLAAQAAYIPGGYNDGNVLFIWLRWDFR